MSNSVGGEVGWYTYDTKEGTLQRHHMVAVGNNTPSTGTTAKPNTTTADTDEADKSASVLGNLLNNYRRPLLIGIIAVAGVAIVVIVILMIAAGGRKKGKH